MKKRQPPKFKNRICLVCSGVFDGWVKEQKFCSLKCNGISQRGPVWKLNERERKMFKKICSVCKQKKFLLKDFHPSRYNKRYSRHSKCKECRNRQTVIWSRKNRDPIKAKINYLKRLESGKMYEAHQKSLRKYPAKQKARIEVRKALLAGKMKRLPCEVCGEKKVHAHHPDYAKPLDVRWLCTKHHGIVHRKYH